MVTPWNGDPSIASVVLTTGFADYSIPQSETPEDIARQVLDGYIATDSSWIAVHGGAPIAGVVGAMRSDKRARIQSMAVAPAHRRRGVGRQILAAFINGTDAAGMESVHLEVIETNVAARSLYESAGFTPARTLNCLRSVGDGGGTPMATRAQQTNPGTTARNIAGPPTKYAARDLPLHRDFTALASMPGVAFHQLPSGGWAAHRGNVLLAAEDWTDEDELRALIAGISFGAAIKIVDVPEGDHLGDALLGLGWSRYTRQVEMIRRA